MIKGENLSKIYKLNSSSVNAVNKVNFSFKDNGLYFITGKSGSGKTTLLNIIGLIDSPDSGTLFFDDEMITNKTPEECNQIRKKYIGFVFQEYNLISDLNVIDNILLSFEINKTTADMNEIDELMRRLGIIDLKERKISELSGGQKQRVAVARCLAKKPRLILADEPTGALDKESSEELYSLLKEISKDITVIVVSHDVDGAMKYGDEILKMDNGQLYGDITTINPTNKFEIDGKKSLLKTNTIIKLGTLFMIKKKIGLLFSMLAIVISVLVLSFSISLLTFDRVSATQKALREEQDNALYISPVSGSYSKITDAAISYVESKTDNYVYGYSCDDSLENYTSQVVNKMYTDITSIVEYDEKSKGILGYEIIFGNEPNDGEVLITEYTFNFFKNNSYSGNKNGYGNITFVPENMGDILGCEINGLTISGVVRYEKNDLNIKYSIMEESYHQLIQNTARNSGVINCLFVKKDSITKQKVLSKAKIKFGNNSKVYQSVIGNSSGHKLVGIDGSNTGVYLDINMACVCCFGKTYAATLDIYQSKYISQGYNSSDSNYFAKNDIFTELKEYYKLNNLVSFDYGLHSYQKEVSGFVDEESLGIAVYFNDELYNEYLTNLCENNINYLYVLNDKSAKDILGYDAKNLDDAMFRITNYECDDLYFINKDMNHLFYIFLFIALGVLFVSIIIMIKQINYSIENHKKDIGILKSLGIENIDVFRIFNIQNIVISVMTCLLSIGLSIWLIKLGNEQLTSEYYYHIEALKFGLINVITIALICVILPIVSSICPIIKISKKRCIDIITRL